MRRILIANRGEIARRIIRTAHAMGLETVAVYSDPDAQALHVREAGQACALGGSSSADSYLNSARLLAAARASGADAIHPGYGFLSENADFAQAVQQAGLTWIGPPPAAIRALGDKAGAKALARRIGVPCLPGYDGPDQDPALLAQQARQVGYPVMVKAVAGGGGRGMRLVSEPQALAEAIASAQSEALAAFGSQRLLLERALTAPRHVEVQILADAQGHCIHLGERDCSLQRRNQKIIEEAPSPAVDAALRERMGACAVQLAQAAGYQGAGTVEFLLQDGQFYLMEMNTRLQVEHPVTEALTGLDLVEWQIRIARGEPLTLTQSQLRWQGHAIEVRLCAEDEHFTPCTGRLAWLQLPPASAFTSPASAALAQGAQLRCDHALEPGLEITPHYDSMLGKLIVHAADRASAIDALAQALRQTCLLGLPTNRALALACLEHPQFRAGQALVPFLQQQGQALRASLATAERQALPAAVLATQLQGLPSSLPAPAPTATTATQSAQSAQPPVLPCPLERPLRLEHRQRPHLLGLRWATPQPGLQPLELRQDGALQHWQWLPDAQPGLRLRQADQELRVHALPGPAGLWQVQTSSGAELWLQDCSTQPAAGASRAQAASELRAPFNGRVIRIAAAPGEQLAQGQTALVIDSMKLEHSLGPSAPVQVQELLVQTGQQVTRGQLLMRFASPPATAPERP
ncbi:hypothetical protein MASR1M59_03260 [Melaminivora sp.]